jgi:starch-binding outer membrane protein, SusD/RagB family
MKKYIFLILFCLVSSALFQDCTKLLDEVKLSDPTADAYYNTKQGFTDLINSCYTQLRTQLTGGQFATQESGTDLWQYASDVETSEFGSYLPTLNASNSFLYNLWSNYYLGIAACNTAINRAAKPITGMSDAEVTAKVGEAYCLRAFYYSILVMNFGGVPKVTDEVSTVITTATRATEAEIYTLIFADLATAEASLPKTNSDFGRANRAVAQALLARINLWTKNYVAAETYAKKVISDYSYTLQPTFAKLWDQDNQVNSEIIWSIQFSPNPRINVPSNALCLYFTPRYDLNPGMTRALNYSRPYPRFMATRHYLDMLQASRWKDARYESVWLEYYMANYATTLPAGMKLGDTAVAVLPYAVTPAFKASKLYKIYDVNSYFNGDIAYGALQQFIAMTKYHDKYRDAINSGTGTRDAFEIRLAEMYLIASEALLMQTPSKPAEAATQINYVRSRAAKAGHLADMQATAGDMNIDFILTERALELGGERYRWIDLKRTGKLLEYARAYNPASKVNIAEKHLLRPIPNNFLDRLTNKADFGQNPGY